MSVEATVEALRKLAVADPRLKVVKVVDINTPAILARNECQGPVCVVGSKTYTFTPEQIEAWRNSFRGLDPNGFTGIDIEDGPNVDVVADLCAPDFVEKHPHLVGAFGLVVCGALLEHVQQPFDAARNVAALVKPGGHLFYMGPWVWGYHPYPDDLWRFSFSGVQALFPGFHWPEWWYSGTIKGIGLQILKAEHERVYFSSQTTGEPETLGDLLTDRRMAYLNIGAIGRKS